MARPSQWVATGAEQWKAGTPVTIETATPRSRRAVLAASAGGLAALAAGALGGAVPVRAANGDVVHVGDDLSGTSFTRITNTAGGPALAGVGATFGTGVEGDSASGAGVNGHSGSGTGVYGTGPIGVSGQSGGGGTGVVGFTGTTTPTPPLNTGIYGESQTGGAGGRGLTGFCSTGIGLLGQTDFGVGVRAYCNNTTGVGLQVTGKAAFDRSGKLTISAGHSSITKTGIGLSALSFILATLQTNVAGLSIQAVVPNPAGSAFTIYLNKAPTVSVVVAWLAVN
jgi:hypothetical protein